MEVISWGILTVLCWYWFIKFIIAIEKEKEKKKKENSDYSPKSA